jgi:sulfatase maturation enzyme AslB (radical SAM superfamily)
MNDGSAHGARVSEVAIVATSRCNQRCSYCYVKGRPAGSPPWPSVRAVVDALLASPVDRVQVGFTGGEPLLARPLIARVVKYVQARRRPGQTVRYRLLTNGLLLDTRTVAWLARHAFRIQISFDGTRDAQERRSRGTFDRLDRLLRRLGRDVPAYFRSHVAVALTVVPETVPYLADSAAYMFDAGVRTIRLTAATSVPEPGTDVLPELERQFDRIYRISLAHFWQTGGVPVAHFRKGLPLRPRQAASPWTCQAPLGQSLVVDVDGQVSTCLMATTTYSEGRHAPASLQKAASALHLGMPDDRLEERLLHVGELASMEGVYSTDARRHSAWGSCRECEWFSACFVCPLMTTGVLGMYRSLRVPSFLCAFNRALLKYRDRFPFQPPAFLADEAFRRSSRRE